MRHLDAIEKYISIKMHDGHNGRLKQVKLDHHEKMVISVGDDGLMYTYLIDKENIKREALFDPLEDVEAVDFMTEDMINDIKEKKFAELRESNPS